MDPKVVAISGHRDLSPPDVRIVWAAMKKLLENPTIDEIWFGGARGTDNEALKAALQYRESQARPKLVVVVPNKLEHQPSECWEWVRKADSLIELGRVITPKDRYAAYAIRNQFLVDHATVLVAFWNGLKSGTGNAVRYARTQKCDVRHIPTGKTV